MYQERYIAFIDILGFKEMVRKSCKNRLEFERLNRDMRLIQRLQLENYKAPYGSAYLGMEFSLFSDSMIISYPTEGPGNAFNILLEIAYICLELVGMGYLFRGGVTVGDLIHENSMCYGLALNRAVEMEQEAKYPRILVDHEVITRSIQCSGRANDSQMEEGFLNGLIKRDEQNIFLNYLELYQEINDWDMYQILMENVHQTLVTEYKRASTYHRIRLQKLLMWYINYYNDTVCAVFKDPSHFLITEC